MQIFLLLIFCICCSFMPLEILASNPLIPLIPIQDVKGDLFAFLENPSPGLYRLPDWVVIPKDYEDSNLLYVNKAGEILLTADPHKVDGINEGNAQTYVKSFPDLSKLRPFYGNNLNLKQVLDVLGVKTQEGKPSRNSFWFFAIDKKGTVSTEEMLIERDPIHNNRAVFVFVSFESDMKNGLEMMSCISLADGSSLNHPQGFMVIHGYLWQ